MPLLAFEGYERRPSHLPASIVQRPYFLLLRTISLTFIESVREVHHCCDEFNSFRPIPGSLGIRTRALSNLPSTSARPHTQMQLVNGIPPSLVGPIATPPPRRTTCSVPRNYSRRSSAVRWKACAWQITANLHFWRIAGFVTTRETGLRCETYVYSPERIRVWIGQDAASALLDPATISFHQPGRAGRVKAAGGDSVWPGTKCPSRATHPPRPRTDREKQTVVGVG